MSLILDALNKADQERSEQHEVPNLRAVHGSPYPQRRPGLLQRWWLEIGFVVLLLLAYLGYQLMVDAGPAPQPAVTHVPPQVNTRPLSPAPAAAAKSLPTKPVPETAPTPAPVASPVVDIATPVQPRVQAPVNSTAELPLATRRDVKLLYAQQASEAVPARVAVPTATSVSAVPSAVKPAQRQPAGAASGLKARLEQLPLLSELSRQKQQQIPSIDFSLHVYSSDQGKGFVTLNGQRRRSGDQVAPGLRLENIVDEFIVLNYQGSKFRLLSLNSWINLQ